MGSISDSTIDEDISPEEMGSKLSSFLEYVKARFAAEDPSTDICVMLHSIQYPDLRQLLHIQAKATSNPSRHHVQRKDLDKFMKLTYEFRDILDKMTSSDGFSSVGVDKVVGVAS